MQAHDNCFVRLKFLVASPVVALVRLPLSPLSESLW